MWYNMNCNLRSSYPAKEKAGGINDIILHVAYDRDVYYNKYAMCKTHREVLRWIVEKRSKNCGKAQE